MQDTDTGPTSDLDLGTFPITPRENLAMAIGHLRKYDICELGPDDHGHSQCWSVGTVVTAVEEITAWIRENRGRLHKPTCMDGNGCRCGLIDLPMWGAAG